MISTGEGRCTNVWGIQLTPPTTKCCVTIAPFGAAPYHPRMERKEHRDDRTTLSGVCLRDANPKGMVLKIRPYPRRQDFTVSGPPRWGPRSYLSKFPALREVLSTSIAPP